MDEVLTTEAEEQPLVRTLSRPQRRALGVLVEKAFTTPDAYPLTLKAVTTGCNQKSNRDPVTNYSEDAVEDTLDELRQLGLVAVVHTESGRTERFRHFMRKRFPFSEPELAIITELLLRGRQQLGELRSRASRMVAIDGQDELREHLRNLADQDFLRADGPLERRGIEVDHMFYADDETPALPTKSTMQQDSAVESQPASSPPQGNEELDRLRVEVEELRTQLSELTDEFEELKRSLGA